MTGDQRIARRGFLPGNVWYAGYARPNGLRGAGHGHVEVLEEPALLGQPVDIGSWIERVTVGTHCGGSQGFEHDEDDIRPLSVNRIGLNALLPAEIKRFRIRLVDA